MELKFLRSKVLAVCLVFFLFQFMITVEGHEDDQITRGTDKIQVNTDIGGNIQWGSSDTWDETFENVNGALFWNGEEWIVNEYYGHMYFWVIESEERFEVHEETIIPHEAGVNEVIGNFTITSEEYTYKVSGIVSGNYSYTSVLYKISDINGPTIYAYSRGNGNGVDQSYFDIFIKQTDLSLVSIREMGIVSNETGTSIEQAFGQKMEESRYIGRFSPGDTEDGNNYYFDIKGGSDMNGISYILSLDELEDTDVTQSLTSGRSYTTDFKVGFRNTENEPNDISFKPKIISEEYIPDGTEIVKNDDGNESSSIVLVAIIVIALIIIAIIIVVFNKMKKK